jgi:hypothetical protein
MVSRLIQIAVASAFASRWKSTVLHGVDLPLDALRCTTRAEGTQSGYDCAQSIPAASATPTARYRYPSRQLLSLADQFRFLLLAKHAVRLEHAVTPFCHT